MEERSKQEIKEECLDDLFTVLDLIGKTNHPEKSRIGESLQTIYEFCERWWET